MDNPKNIPEKRAKRPDELVLTNSEQSQSQLFGLDKNLIIILVVTGVSLCASFYLFKEVKKLRDDVRILKAQEIDQDLIEKVEENSESVKAIELKMDQLITALSARERKMANTSTNPLIQSQQSPNPSPQFQENFPRLSQANLTQLSQLSPSSPTSPTSPTSPPQVNEHEYQNQQIMQQQMAQQLQQRQQEQANQSTTTCLEDPCVIKI